MADELPDGDAPKRTKKRSKKRGPESTVFEEVNVLVTGFQDLSPGVPNAAWQIAKSLPPILETTPAHPSRIKIAVHPTPIPVTYKACASFLDDLYKTNPNKYHLILHVSVSKEGHAYKLERYARSKGYEQKDLDGVLAADIPLPAFWNSETSRAETSAHQVDVMERWRSTVEDAELVLSEDAGHYVAELLFFASLCYVLAATKRDNITWQHRTTVELLHVPPASDDATITKGVEVIKGLLYSIIDSRRQRDGDYEDETEGD